MSGRGDKRLEGSRENRRLSVLERYGPRRLKAPEDGRVLRVYPSQRRTISESCKADREPKQPCAIAASDAHIRARSMNRDADRKAILFPSPPHVLRKIFLRSAVCIPDKCKCCSRRLASVDRTCESFCLAHSLKYPPTFSRMAHG